jgi:hypothetical protein
MNKQMKKTGSMTIMGALMLLAVLCFAALGTIGCSNEKNVSFNTLEEAKTTARENSLFNAQRYRQENPRFQGWSVIPNGDSSQMPNCPQGDGWATLKLINPDRTAEVSLKCSTVSAATMCLLDSEFKQKPYAAQDGHCQDTSVVPHPLPKIVK